MGPLKDTLWGRWRSKSRVCLLLVNSPCHLTNVISLNIHWAPRTKKCNILCKKRKPTVPAFKSLGKQAATFNKDELHTATPCPNIIYIHLSGVNSMSISTQGCELMFDNDGRKMAGAELQLTQLENTTCAHIMILWCHPTPQKQNNGHYLLKNINIITDLLLY